MQRIVYLIFFSLQKFFLQSSSLNDTDFINSPHYQISENCLNINGYLCVNDGQKIISTANIPTNLIGWYTFDDKFALDSSHSKNHFINTPEVGPENGGNGYSAYFSSKSISMLNHINEYETQDLTICFWIFLLQQPSGSWRSIIRKGNTLEDRTPTIQLWPKLNRFHIRVTTEDNLNEGLDSDASIPIKRWTHIAISFSKYLIQLYVNSILDQELVLKSPLKINQGQFYIGKDIQIESAEMLLDNLRIYNVTLKQSEVMALSYVANTLQGQNYARLGCASCNFETALISCSQGYHLCSLSELYQGGYHIARVNGWFRLNNEIWYKSKDINNDQYENNNEKYKMAICCINY